MKTKFKYGAALLVFASLTACQHDTAMYQPNEEQTEREAFNDFDYSTVAKTQLNIDFNLDVNASVYFEVYDEEPATLVEEVGYVKKGGITPLYAGFTEEGGTFSGKVSLPSYLSKVYIYTPAFFAQSVIEAKVSGNTITAKAETKSNDEQTSARRKVTSTRLAYYSYMDEDVADYTILAGWRYKTWAEYFYTYDFNWHKWLGKYDPYSNGKIDYQYYGELRPTTSEIEALYTEHQKVINIDQPCPESYRSYSDLKVCKDAEVAVSFVGQNTCWNSSVGYYYYADGQEPKSLGDVNVIMLFPNTQDGNYTVFPSESYRCAGIDRGTTVQLKYYPNIASGSKDDATTIFPEGTRIGFVLATNAWGNRLSNDVTGWQTETN